jgi:hypothetical protein
MSANTDPPKKPLLPQWSSMQPYDPVEPKGWKMTIDVHKTLFPQAPANVAKIGDVYFFRYPKNPQQNCDLRVTDVEGVGPENYVHFDDGTLSKQKNLTDVLVLRHLHVCDRHGCKLPRGHNPDGTLDPVPANVFVKTYSCSHCHKPVAAKPNDAQVWECRCKELGIGAYKPMPEVKWQAQPQLDTMLLTPGGIWKANHLGVGKDKK